MIITIKEAQAEIDRWIKQYGGGYFSELTNLGILAEETGELAHWMVREYGDQTLKPEEKEVDRGAAIRDELTDVLWVLICLANQLDIDLTSAPNQNLQKKTDRDKFRHIKE